RVDAAGHARAELTERPHLADPVAEIDQQDRDVRGPEHPASQGVAGGGARLQHRVHTGRAAKVARELPDRPAEEHGGRYVPRPHRRVQALREELLELGGPERAWSEQ